jgi:ATP-dependent exoDNAse (exonuclease V) beta subunit
VQQLSTFQVYNASAGSGKTFTLVKEYLKVLLNSDDIYTFQKILAITFTNKAAGEMKERVLHNLQEFSEGKKNDLARLIIEETAIEVSIIQKRSQKILAVILQNYSAFSITTIDSFTHKLVKSFAFDVDLSLNFEVEMDALSLLNEAVDVLISKIGTEKKITKTLIDFSLEKTDDDKSWDISRELNEFAKILLNEEDTAHFRKLANKSLDDFTILKAKLLKQQQDIKKELKEIGETGLKIIEQAHLEHKDFYYSLLPKHFLSLAAKPEKNVFFDSNKLKERIAENLFYSKNKPEAIKTSIEEVIPSLLDLYAKSEQFYKQFIITKLVLKNIIPLAVLNNLNSELTFLKEENNIRLNAEFNQLISDNIKDQPAPFIYERLGQRFTHYFIDEMQDTSVLQWQNLIPLIENALAQENSNLLLVGDGKQAIYRWRGGKAEQFINLGSSDAESRNPFPIKKEIKELETNYRSYSEIIHFNNSFFQHAANFLQEEAYKKIFIEGNKQIENNKKGGYVSISFLEKEEDKEVEKLKYSKKVLEKIGDLKSRFLLSEICILVRKKKDGIVIANYLSENGIDIISSETLLLQNSTKVTFIIDVLQVIQHPNDEETRFNLLYFLHQHLPVKVSKHQFLSQLSKLSITIIFEALEEYGICFDLQGFYQLPFYEKIENIIRAFKLIDSSNAYVQFFLDVVLEQQRKGTDIQEFLSYWERKKDNLSIVAPESANAVQIMTVHKSKGLEFPVVIFPCDVDIYRQIEPKVWLDALPESCEGFEELLVPYAKDLSYVNNRGLQIFNKERAALELDNFNLLYVALTRSVEQLYIITDKKLKGRDKIENLNFYSGIFINYLKENSLWTDSELEYSFGDKKRTIDKKEEKSSNLGHQKFISTPWQEHQIMLLANASKLWDTKQGKAIDSGNLWHEILAQISTKNDIERVVSKYHLQGVLDEEQTINIKKKCFDIVNHPMLKMYYSNEVVVFNEREIISQNNEIIIPDRLVFTKNRLVTIIDYKTGVASKTHHQQVLNYAQVLKSLNFNIEKKLLVYITGAVLVEEVLMS